MRGHFDYTLRDLYKGELACSYELCVSFNGFRPAPSSRIFHEGVAIFLFLFGDFGIQMRLFIWNTSPSGAIRF